MPNWAAAIVIAAAPKKRRRSWMISSDKAYFFLGSGGRASTQCAEAFAEFLAEQRRLFPGGEMAALVEPVIVDELWIRLLRPAPRGGVDLLGKGAHRGRERNPFGGEG